MNKKIILITGPTASGKSNLAMEIGDNFDSVIINADSMQVYKEIPIISAQPSTKDRLRIPHELYSIVSGEVNYSVGLWLEAVSSVVNGALKENIVPIIVGGTGLYFKSLVFGLVEIPDIEDGIKSYTRELYERLGKEEFYRQLKNRDSNIEAKIKSTDKQRMIRAFEVFEQTGRSIAHWQKIKTKDPMNMNNFFQLHLDIDRQDLYKNIDNRFLSMVEDGAIDEVEYIKNSIGEKSLPAMKAHGIAELSLYLDGEIDLNAAISKSQKTSRNYAKRQITWFKHQMPGVNKVICESNKCLPEYIAKIKSHLAG